MNKNTAINLPRHVIWDWNGTLQDDVQAAVNGINLLLRQRNMPQVTVERHRELFTFPVSIYYRELGFALENENWDALANTFINAFASDSSAKLFSSTVPTLARFAAYGVPMSILSACQRSVLEGALDKNGIRGYFNTVKGLDDPNAHSKLNLAKELFIEIGAPLDDVWIVGDTMHDKEVADSAGCRCILVASGYQSRARLGGCDCPVLESIGEVPAFFGMN